MSGADQEPLPIDRFDYELPPELIAQQPIEPRDAARLLVVARHAEALSDRRFVELPHLLNPGDLLVLNDTRVLPARLRARRHGGGAVELLLLRRHSMGVWEAIARPARRLRPGAILRLTDHSGADTGTTIRVAARNGDVFRVVIDDEDSIRRAGELPLPPYIASRLANPERYQTVYGTREGSAAAPTAGLHFTERTLAACRARGIGIARITLHVGLDTFQPMRVANARDHEIHSEWREATAATIEQVRDTCRRGGRVIAVGTTSARTLESLADTITGDDPAMTVAGCTRLYITPGYTFRVVDGLLTNFHLPRTSLLLLVSALAGEATIRQAYAHAITERYRFYSFGDAMLIV